MRTKECLPSFLSFAALQYRSPRRRRFATLRVCPDDRFLSSTEERAPSSCLSRIMGIKLFFGYIFNIDFYYRTTQYLCLISEFKNLLRIDMNVLILQVWRVIPFTAEILMYWFPRCCLCSPGKTCLNWRKHLTWETRVILRILNKEEVNPYWIHHLVHACFGHRFIIWYLNVRLSSRQTAGSIWFTVT